MQEKFSYSLGEHDGRPVLIVELEELPSAELLIALGVIARRDYPWVEQLALQLGD